MLVFFKKFFFVVLFGLTFFLTGCVRERYHKGHDLVVSMSMVCVKPSTWTVYPQAKGARVELSGSDVEACAEGRVVFVDLNFRGYGKTIIIENAENFSSVYTRVDEVFVAEGDFVKSGQRIARAAQSNDGKFLFYFELRKKSVAINPVEYLH